MDIDQQDKMDTLYFTDLNSTLAQMEAIIKPGGRFAICYAHGANPGGDFADLPRKALPPDHTSLAVALASQTRDFTPQDLTHAGLRQKVLPQLEWLSASEDNRFLYENRLGEANGIARGIGQGPYRRYLYFVRKDRSE